MLLFRLMLSAIICQTIAASDTGPILVRTERFKKLEIITEKIYAEMKSKVPGQQDRLNLLLDEFDVERPLVIPEGKILEFDKECPLKVANDTTNFFKMPMVVYAITCNPVHVLKLDLAPKSSFSKTATPGVPDNTLTDKAILEKLSTYPMGTVLRARVMILVDLYIKTRPHERSYIWNGEIIQMPRSPRIKVLEILP